MLKRIMSLVLTVCMAVSFMAPIVSASGGTEPSEVTVEYNFYPEGHRGNFANHKTALDAKYLEETINWRYEAGSQLVHNAVTNVTGASKVTIGNNQGLRVLADKGDWIAFRLRVAKAGNYDLTLVRGLMGSGTRAANIYIMPGTTTDIAGTLATATPLSTINYKADANDYSEKSEEIGSYNFAEAGEYILVFEAAEGATDTDNHAYFVFYRLEMKELVEPEMPVYDFYPEGHRGNFVNHKTALDEAYSNETINWRYEAGSELVHNAVTNVAGATKVVIGNNQGFRVLANKGDWIAFRLRVAEAGNYDLTLVRGLMGSGTRAANIYIMPGTTTDIAGTLATATPLSTINYKADANDYSERPEEIGSYNFAEAGEYILVFEAEQGATDTDNHAYFVFYRLEMKEHVEPEMPVYDFYIEDFRTDNFCDHKADIDQRYENGEMNWRYEAGSSLVHGAVTNVSSQTKMMIVQNVGFRILTNAEDWVAFRIRVDEAGEYDLNLVRGYMKEGTTACNVYVLPGSTTNVANALESADPLHTISFKADANDYREVESRLGPYNFTEAGEYIIVFESELPGNGSHAYMSLYRLLLEEPTGEPPEGVSNMKDNTLVLGEPHKTFAANNFAVSNEINGHDYFYIPVKNSKLYVYDLDTKKKVDEESTGITTPLGVAITPDGIVYIAGNMQFMYKYDPYTGVGERIYLPNVGATNYYNINSDENGNLYFGTYPDAKLYRYSPASGTFTEYSNFDPDAKYVFSNVYHDGYVYANTYGDANNDGVFSKKIVKINAETKEVVKTLDISEKLGTVKYMFCMSIVGGNTLLGGQSAGGKMVAVDLETFDFIDVGLETTCTFKVSEELNGKAYFVSQGVGLCEYDIATRQAKAIDGFSVANIPIRFVNNSFVTIENDPDLPGQSLLTCSNSGPIVFYNLETGKMVKWTDVTINDGTGQTIRSLANGAEGSNKIYIGAYHNGTGAIYDTEAEAFAGKFTTTGQTDSLLWHNGKLYAGTYANCDLVELDPDTGSSDVLFTLKKDFWQTRIHTLVAGDNKIFAGTVPDAGLHGGYLAWYDLETQRTYVVAEEDKVFYQKADSKGTWYDAKTDTVVDLDADNDGAAEFQFKGIVENQSVMCLIYHDGYIYGTTSKYGGASTTLDDFPGEAVVFIYDVNNMRKVGEYTLNLDGVSAKYISGIAFDPDFDNNGKIWGIVSETLFSFTIDWPNNTLISKEELSYHRDDYPLGGTRYWFPRSILFGDDGYMYVGFNSNGGFRRINPNNPADNKLLMTDVPMFYVLGEDGNLYYANSAQFKMLALNYSSQDEAAAEAVDALIKGIGEVTLESEAVITAAQDAYDALTNTQKALVSEYNKLEDAQATLKRLKAVANRAAVDVVIAQINTIGTVTLESADSIAAARAAYNALTDEQKAMVTNLSTLTAAEAKLAELKDTTDKNAADQAAADAVKATVDAIGEVTLESEEAIKAAREAYNALTEEQKSLVSNLDALTAAEAKLAELKAAAADAERIQAARDVVGKALAAMTVTNDTSKEAIQKTIDEALKNAGITDAEAAVTDVAVTKATTEKAGSAKITVVITSGKESVSTTQTKTIAKLIPPVDPENPQTGDETNLLLPVLLMLLSVIGIVVGLVFSRKLSYKGKYLK